MTALERLAWRKKARLKHGNRPKIYPLVDLNAREVPMVSVSKHGNGENPDDILGEHGQALEIKPLQRRLREAKIVARKHDEEEHMRKKLAEKAEIERRIFKNVEDLLSSDDSESDDDEEEEKDEELEDQEEQEEMQMSDNAEEDDTSDSDDNSSSSSSSSSDSRSRSSPVLTY